MMNTVPALSIFAMVITLLISFGVPIGLCIYMKVKNHAKLSSFFIGCGIFILFALILEQIFHALVGLFAKDILTSHIWLYAVYGGLCAGLFEETGRFVAMKYFMKNSLDKQNAIMYGIGHGGVESVLLIGLTYVSNLILAAVINAGQLETLLAGVDVSVMEGLSPLWELPSYQFLMAGIERISAIILHIVLSYLVYLAVKNRKWSYFIIAIAIHALVDTGTVLLAQYVPVVAMELILLAVVAALAVFIYWDYRQDSMGE